VQLTAHKRFSRGAPSPRRDQQRTEVETREAPKIARKRRLTRIFACRAQRKHHGERIGVGEIR
jgi:hypothetical protein